MSDSNSSLSDRRLECFGINIIDDDIVESREMITFTFGTVDPPAPQVVETSNAMIVIEDDDGEQRQLYNVMIVFRETRVKSRTLCISLTCTLPWNYTSSLKYIVVVDIGFENVVYSVSEAVGSAEFCVVLTGRIEREFFLSVIIIPAVSPGNESSQLQQIQYSTSLLILLQIIPYLTPPSSSFLPPFLAMICSKLASLLLSLMMKLLRLLKSSPFNYLLMILKLA